MAEDDTGNVSDTNRRFEIFVPSPKARVNLGAPNKDSTGPFGYTGVSIQSDVHLFIDANKHTLFQTGQNYCGQVGGKWLQYSNADMVLSSTANVNVSADKKILIAAGAGQGQVTALDHGTTPRAVPYNALELHYRVDRLQSAVYEFFHGRRKRDEYTGTVKAVLEFGGAPITYFDRDSKASSYAQDEQDLQGGFYRASRNSLYQLYPVDQYWIPPADQEPLTILEPLLQKKVMGEKVSVSSLEFGFTKYLNRFDPYSKIDTSHLTNPIAKGLGGFRNLLAKMRRFADVATKYAHLITDNFLMKRAQALMSAVDNLAKATQAAYNFVDLTFGSFIPGRDPNANLFAAMQDEAKSGWGSRLGSTKGGLSKAGDAEREKVAGKKASLQSDRGTFDLTGKTSLTIEWGGSPTASVTINLAQGSPATHASLSFTVAGDVLLALPVRVRIDLAAIDAHAAAIVPAWVPEAEIVAWVAAQLSVSASSLAGATSADTDVTPPRASVRVLLSSLATITDATETFEEATPAGGAAPPSATLRLGSFVTLTVQKPAQSLRISVDGTTHTVTLDPGASGLDVTDATAARTHVIAALTSALSNASVAGDASTGAVTLDSRIAAASSRIVVRDGAERLLEGLGLTAGQEARGSARVPGLDADALTKVSASQIVRLVGSRTKLSASVTGGTLTLKSGHAPASSAPSRVKVTGSMAGAVFTSSQENVVEVEEVSDTRQNLAAADAEYKTLLSWNHELQKLPEDTRNLTRPIRNAINEVVGAASALEKACESVVDFVGGALKGLPAPPEAIGLIADEGITLGTRDRIVGIGGKGVIFVTDGGTGDEDHAKFIPKVEQFVNLALAWDPIDRTLAELLETPAEEKKRPKSLGFRVLSDSTVDLFGSHSAQLMALGRGKLKAAGADGEQVIGTGITRVAGSYAAEVAAYRKVVISARNRGKDDKTGGRVELAGQTIAIGGMNVENDTKDFDSTKDTLFGIAPLSLDALTGSEHLSKDQKETLQKELDAYAWPKNLRDGGADGHPSTERVFVHAAKETIVQVGTYLVHVDATKGVTIGTRKPNADPTLNEIDEEKPHLELTDLMLSVYANKDTKTFWDADGVGIYHKADGANVLVESSKVTLAATATDSITIQQGKTTLSSQTLGLLGKTAVEIKADGTIKIG